MAQYDLCVIGGGINGTGIARDAAGRGLSVLLVEARDLACATSSASTKLIHGGLRYLEYFEFSLVRQALKERERLMRIAPHLIRPQSFVLPHAPDQRPYWMVRAGLFLYDHLARRNILPGSRGLDLSEHSYGDVLLNHYARGFEYADCWADDSRLVVLNAVDAAEKGAAILTHTRCVGVEAAGGVWQVSLLDEKTGEGRKIRASMVVNAAGPWVNDVVGLAPALSGDAALPHVRLVKGSHIIIDRAFDGDQAYILQQPDKRIVFVIPYEGRFTLIGTTEEDFNGDVYAPMLSEGELTYLVDAYNRSFKRSIAKDDVLWSYSGVRPLFDTGDVNATSASRDYKFYNHPDTVAPFVSVFGGKLTTYRVLAERLVNQLLHLDNRYAPPWTAGRPLPGGDIKCDDFAAFLTAQKRRYAWLPDVLLSRYARAYGTRMDVFLDGAQSLSDLGRSFGDDVYEAEIVYMLRYEFAREAEDLLWRRSKLGLHAGDKTVQAVSDYVARYHRNKARYG